jgi:hypothetical protein
MIVNQLIKDALTLQKKDIRLAYIAPTYKMAKNIVWDYLKKYAFPIPGMKFNESELRADFPNGARVRLYGADNPDSLRGIYLDGCVFDEYAQCRPSMFTEIIRPALSDRIGYCIFIGTPKGRNHFYELYEKAINMDSWDAFKFIASETGYVLPEELAEAKSIMSEDEFLQEYECSFDAAIKGAIYADYLNTAKEEGRVTEVKYDANLPVYTAWDIGWSDDTTIIFFQIFKDEIRVIDSYSNNFQNLEFYAEILREKEYKYDTHFFPWDSKIKPMSSGKSTLDIAISLGMKCEVVPSLSVLDGINFARKQFPNMYFDEENNAGLLKAIEAYQREYDEKKQVFKPSPLHNWASHYADAFRYMAISIKKHVALNEEEYHNIVESYNSSQIYSKF